MPQQQNANNGQPGASSGQPPAGAKSPEVNGFAAGVAPPVQDDPPAGASGTQDPPAGSETPEIPEAYRAEDGSLDSTKALARLTEIEQRAATRKEKFGDLPEGDYTFGEIELEGGEKVSIDTENPFLKEALGLFREAEIGQKGAEQLAALYAKAMIGDVPKFIEAYVATQQEAINQEIESLGDKKQARIDSVAAGIDTLLGTEGAPLKGAGLSLLKDIRTRANFETLEKLLALIDPDNKGRIPGGQVTADNEDPVVDMYGSRGSSKKQGVG